MIPGNNQIMSSLIFGSSSMIDVGLMIGMKQNQAPLRYEEWENIYSDFESKLQNLQPGKEQEIKLKYY